ncbi:MAG: helix-turn-helix domain-containing protein [Parvularculaceae bacterium]|nr:helix-turn-helix domain-containing protein [Parvularculaceae bacterium]
MTHAPEDILQFSPPPADLAAYLFGFAHRRDTRGGDVVLILPEARTSVQVRRADPYHLRERADGSAWREVPPVSLWGPRLARGYGYAARRIEVFGIGLTPAGFRTLTGAAPGEFVNETAPLEAVAPTLAAAIGKLAAATFDDWRSGVIDILRAATAAAEPAPPILDALRALGETASVPEAARRLGLSERHFRRLFAQAFGASPKSYARILRFDRTLRRLHPRPWETPDLLATDDYADQAHLIREFCAFANITPGAYVKNKQRYGDRILRSIVVEGVLPPAA